MLWRAVLVETPFQEADVESGSTISVTMSVFSSCESTRGASPCECGGTRQRIGMARPAAPSGSGRRASSHSNSSFEAQSAATTYDSPNLQKRRTLRGSSPSPLEIWPSLMELPSRTIPGITHFLRKDTQPDFRAAPASAAAGALLRLSLRPALQHASSEQWQPLQLAREREK